MRSWLRLHICFDDRYTQDDGYEAGLNGFWRLVNLLQFLPDMTFTSRKAVHLPQESVDTKVWQRQRQYQRLMRVGLRLLSLAY